jgi:hypothetical protein
MLAMTTVTKRILRQAQQRGFRVRTSLAGGRAIHYLDQHGQDGSFGAVYVGQRTGRITGAVLHRGNEDAAGTRYRGALATGRAIRETAARPAGFAVWSTPTHDEQGRPGWVVQSLSGTLLVTAEGHVRWSDRAEVLHTAKDLEQGQRWAEQWAENHAHPAAET